MFEVVNRDGDVLKGRAIIYTRNALGEEGSPVNPKYPGFFVGATAEDMKDIMECYNPPLLVTEIVGKIGEAIAQQGKQIEEGVMQSLSELGEIPEEARDVVEGTLRMYAKQHLGSKPCALYFFSSEEDMERGGERGDIVRLTDSNGIGHAIPLLNSGADLYLETYSAQRELLGSECYVKSFIEMTPGEFSAELINVTGRLMYAAATGMNRDREYAVLRRMASGDEVMKRKMEHYIEVSQFDDPKKIPIMDALIIEMTGIATGDFKQAAEGRDQRLRLDA